MSIAFGQRIKRLRLKKGWTQADMSAETGLDRAHISEIECGRVTVNLITLQTLAGCFQTTMSRLLSGL
jgi:transcriptional regulator with XRE-family HTH domain